MPNKSPRFTLPLLKAVVSDVTDTGFKLGLMDSKGQVNSTISVAAGPGKMAHIDLRNTDILTIFTEVLLKEGAGNA